MTAIELSMASIRSVDRARLACRELGVRTSRVVRAGFAVALLAAAVVGTPSASAAWTAPADLSVAGQSAFDPRVAVDDDGDFVFAWTSTQSGWDRGRAQARTLSATRALGPVQTLSPAPGARIVDMSVDRDGDALFGWQRTDGVSYRPRVRSMSAAGAVGVGQTVSATGTDGYGPWLDVDEDGDAVVVWLAWDSVSYTMRVYGRTRSAAGVLGPIVALSSTGYDAYSPDVAVDPDGNAVVTWYQLDGTDFRIWARTLSASGVVGLLQTLSDSGQHSYHPQVAVDRDGDAVFTWYSQFSVDNRVRARTMSATGVLGAIRTLSDPGQTPALAKVVVDADGDATFVWVRPDGNNYRVQGTTMSKVGTLGLVATLSDSGEDAIMPDVAVNDVGDAVFTWENDDGVDHRIKARDLSASGTPGPTWNVSDAGQWALEPKVAVHDNDAIITWSRGNAYGGTTIQYAAHT